MNHIFRSCLGISLALLAFSGAVASPRQALAASPTLSVSESSGAPGDTVLISGTGFAPFDLVNVQWCAPSGCQTSSTALGSVRFADANGNFGGVTGKPALITIIPSDANDGATYTIQATGVNSGLTASFRFPVIDNAQDQGEYYLALGDSLSQGVQPDPTGLNIDTTQGYVSDIYQYYHATLPDLQLMNMGCPGERTRTMIQGGFCPYSLGSQLNQAVNFLSTHDVVLITIDMGANNIVPCFGATSINQTCVTNGTTNVQNQLPTIISQLQQAAPGVPIYAMNYYDPYLQYWLGGSNGPSLATQSEQIVTSFNSTLGQLYANANVSVVDVQTAFGTTNFTVSPPSTLPANVQTICNWTWMCPSGTATPNIHATAAGYSQIASAFENVIGPIIPGT